MDKAMSSEILRADVMVRRKVSLKVRNFREVEAKGLKGPGVPGADPMMGRDGPL